MIVTKSNITTEKRKYWTRDIFNDSDRMAHIFFGEGMLSIFNHATTDSYNYCFDSIENQNIETTNVEREIKFKDKSNLNRFLSYYSHGDWIFKTALLPRAYLPTLASGRIAVAKDVNVASNKKVDQPYRHRLKNTMLYNLKNLISLNFVRGLWDTYEIYDSNFLNQQANKGLVAINRATHLESQKEPQLVYDLTQHINVGRRNDNNLVTASLTKGTYTERKPISLTNVKDLIAIAKQEEAYLSDFFEKFVIYHFENNLINNDLAQQLLWANEMFLNKTKTPKYFVNNEAYQQMIDINRNNDTSNEKHAYDKASKVFNNFVLTLYEFFKYYVADFLGYVPERIYVRYNENQALNRQIISNRMYNDWTSRNKMAKAYCAREERFRDHMFAYKSMVNKITEEGMLTLTEHQKVVFEDDVPVSVCPNLIEETPEGKVFSMFPKELLSNFESIPIIPELIYDSSMRYDWGDKLTEEENYYKATYQGLDFGTTGGDIMFLHLTTYSTIQTSDIRIDGQHIDELSYIRYDILQDKNQDKVYDILPKVTSKLSFKREGRKSLIKALVPDFTGNETDWQVQEIKEKDLINGFGFVPVMIPITYDDYETFNDSKDVKSGFMVILVNFGSITNVIKKATYQEAMLQLISAVSDKTRAKKFFTDREEFLKQINTVASVFGIHNNKQYKTLLKLFGSSALSNLEKQIKSLNNISLNEVPETQIIKLFAKPKIDKQIKDKIEKQKQAASDMADKFTGALNCFNENGLKLNSTFRSIISQQKRIRSLQNNLKEEVERLQDLLTDKSMLNSSYKQSLSFLSGYINPKLKADKLLQKANEDYNKEIKRAIDENQYDLDSYLKNLATNDIRINKVEIQEETENQKKIKTLVFSVLKPVKIKVDGSDTNVIYGGPYTLTLLDGEKMHISLLDPTSIMGWNDEQKLAYVHPHASSVNITNSSDKKQSFLSLYESGNRYCCLGEASPYIWKAMNSGDLTMTIINAIIWLTSANSSDYWGRNYIYFPKSLQHNELNEKTAEEIAKEIMTSITPDNEEDIDDDSHDCEYSSYGECNHCGRECEHEEHDEDGNCMECGMYHEWAEQYEEEEEVADEDFRATVNVNVVTNNTGYTPYTNRNN